MESEASVPFDRHKVKIQKRVTDPIFAAFQSYVDLRTYAKIYQRLAQKRCADDNEQWKAAIAAEYGVSLIHTLSSESCPDHDSYVSITYLRRA